MGVFPAATPREAPGVQSVRSLTGEGGAILLTRSMPWRQALSDLSLWFQSATVSLLPAGSRQRYSPALSLYTSNSAAIRLHLFGRA